MAAASVGPGGHPPTLTGSGSTFDAPFFSVAFAEYEQQHPAVSIDYSAVGSSAGAGARLHLTGPVLAAIYLGQITSWNDPAITALNPGITLPPAKINVVHRSDGSGTTYIFSNYLSSISPAWAARVGTGKTLTWPTGQGADGNGGVVAVNRNQAGNYVTPSAQTVAADAAQKPAITPTDFSIVNEPGAASYPISGYSWALIYTRQTGQATGQALVAMLDWLTHDGQAYAAANGRPGSFDPGH